MSTSWTRQEDKKLLEYVKSRLEKGQEKTELLTNRLEQLEQIVEEQQQQLNKLKKDLRFFELMLIEEYHLLIRLLGEDKQKIRIHSL